MNAKRRQALQAIKSKLYELQSELDSLKDEEQEAYDNMPEALQGSDRGEKCSAAIDTLNDGSYSLEEAINQIDEACE